MSAYVEEVDNQFDFTNADHWKEIIDSAAFPSTTHLSNDAQEATLVGFVPWNKQRAAERFFLGHSYADDFVPYRLYRENPHRHPTRPQLRAHDVSCTPYIPKNNEDEGRPKIESPWTTSHYTAYAEHVICTVRYRSFRMDFLEDTDIATAAEEWKRSTVIDIDPRIDVLTADGVSQLRFVEGDAPINPPGVGAPGGPNGVKLPAPFGILQPKMGLMMLWASVPWNYLSQNPNIFYPTKILDCMGRVNSTTCFDVFTKSTLLMQPPRFTFKPAVVPEENGDPAWLVDVLLHFDFFSPEKKPALAGTAYQGHQAMPWRADGFYYGAVRDDGTSELLKYADFNTIFEHVSS